MRNLLITTSVILLSLSSSVLATENTNNLQTQNNICSSVKEMKSTNYLTNPLIAREVIIDSRPSYDQKCGPYYTMCKDNGKCYECIKCTYGGPYCWEKSN